MHESRYFLDGIKRYLDAKKTAVEKILSAQPPANDVELRTFHSLYFSSLLSAIEFIKDDKLFAQQKNNVDELISNSLSLPDFPDGEKNYAYIRELRNSLMHRGLDVTESALVLNEKICVLSPEYVTNKSGSEKYSAFGKYLFNIIYVCETRVCSAIFETLRIRGYLDQSMHSLNWADFSDALNEAKHVPVEVKLEMIQRLASLDMTQLSVESFGDFLRSAIPAPNTDLTTIHYSIRLAT